MRTSFLFVPKTNHKRQRNSYPAASVEMAVNTSCNNTSQDTHGMYYEQPRMNHKHAVPQPQHKYYGQQQYVPLVNQHMGQVCRTCIWTVLWLLGDNNGIPNIVDSHILLTMWKRAINFK